MIWMPCNESMYGQVSRDLTGGEALGIPGISGAPGRTWTDSSLSPGSLNQSLGEPRALRASHHPFPGTSGAPAAAPAGLWCTSQRNGSPEWCPGLGTSPVTPGSFSVLKWKLESEYASC